MADIKRQFLVLLKMTINSLTMFLEDRKVSGAPISMNFALAFRCGNFNQREMSLNRNTSRDSSYQATRLSISVFVDLTNFILHLISNRPATPLNDAHQGGCFVYGGKECSANVRSIDPTAMGFPLNWDKEPFWNLT